MTHTTLPEQELLAEYLELDPSIPQGLRWRKKAARNTVIGSPAGRCHRNGYWEVRFQKVLYKTNRIVYRLATGEDPGELEVDHIDRDRSNNAASNLRPADRRMQALNRTMGDNPYAYWCSSRNRWVAQWFTARPEKKCMFVGYYNTAKDASEAAIAHRKHVFGIIESTTSLW